MHTRNSLRLAFVFGENKLNIFEYEILCVLGLLAAMCCVHSKFTQMAVVKITAHLLFTMLMSTKVNTLIYSKFEHNIAHNSFFISRKCGKNTERYMGEEWHQQWRWRKIRLYANCVSLDFIHLVVFIVRRIYAFMRCERVLLSFVYNIKLHNSITQKQGKWMVSADDALSLAHAFAAFILFYCVFAGSCQVSVCVYE